MPVYDYACGKCRHRFEVSHAISADGPASCPACGEGPVRKAFAPPAILFKGSGWAKMDRRSSSKPSSSTGSGGDSASSDTAGGTSPGAPSTTPATGPATAASSDTSGSTATAGSTSD